MHYGSVEWVQMVLERVPAFETLEAKVLLLFEFKCCF
jgi:hypothetical protein